MWLLPLRLRYRWQSIGGAGLHGLLLCAGALLLWLNDPLHDPHALARITTGDALVVELTAPPLEKPSSWKVEARAVQAHADGRWTSVSGGVLLYLRKENGMTLPVYGQQLLVQRWPGPVRSSGNPGAFDQARWCRFQGITHSAFLNQGEYALLPVHRPQPLRAVLFRCRDAVISTIRRHVPGNVEAGLCEALLIGYKNDLDADLLRTYSRTGVVHVIAISGMHLALIYGLLLALTRPMGTRLRWLRCMLVLAGLWAFSLLAGGGPSVLRASVMFSFLAVGNLLGRKGDSINTLLLAALVLLAINPFWLWDVGFQLSFAAVGSILLFQRPIAALYAPESKLLRLVWQATAVTLAAQVLTTPLTLYHFHQFPLLFLLANLVAIPLSGLLVYALIGLCVLAPFPSLAKLAGMGIGLLAKALNGWVEGVNKLPGASWEGLSISATQAVLLYGLLALAGWAWLRRERPRWRLMAACTVAFFTLRTFSFLEAGAQARLIVFNVSRHAAIELHQGRQALFRGDSTALQDPFITSFHLQPARVQDRTGKPADWLPAAFIAGNKVVVHLGEGESFPPLSKADILVLSHRPRVRLDKLVAQARPGLVVIDASVPRRKAQLWKQDCAQAGIRCHDVSEYGAFVMDL